MNHFITGYEGIRMPLVTLNFTSEELSLLKERNELDSDGYSVTFVVLLTLGQ